MNILVIGSGGREHAIVYALKNSDGNNEIYAAPGNPGILQLAKKADINVNDFAGVAQFCKNFEIELVVVGPEQPLSEGIADFLTGEGINVFGPTKEAAKLESSKIFAKQFMQKYSIPTAAYASFTAEDDFEAHNFIESSIFPVVIKADGLAAGKGVTICSDKKTAHETLDSYFSGMFDSAGKSVVIEEFMEGEEASILALCDGNDYVILASSQDHKRIFDNDEGPNTGGMGAYSPADIVTPEILNKVKETIIKPALKGMQSEGTPFRGCLYTGLMIKNGISKVVEFNVRFGDPETQAVLCVFKGDLAGLLLSAALGNIDKSKMTSKADSYACCVILASNGYPGKFAKGFEISGLNFPHDDNKFIFHAGTAFQGDKIITSGGRVLGVTGKGESLQSAINNAYEAVKHIHFENMFYRKDIGYKGLK